MQISSLNIVYFVLVLNCSCAGKCVLHISSVNIVYFVLGLKLAMCWCIS